MTDHDPQAMRPALAPTAPQTPSKAPVASAGPPVRLTRKRDDGTWEHVWVVSGVGDWRGGTNEAAWVVVDVLRRIVGTQRAKG